MAVDYRPIAFHPETASLQVKFWNSDIPEGVQFSVPIPLVDGQYPVGEDLDRVIRACIPHDLFEAAAAGNFGEAAAFSAVGTLAYAAAAKLAKAVATSAAVVTPVDV